MAARKAPIGGGLASELLGEAAGPMDEPEPVADEFDDERTLQETFEDMCAAIREGNDAEAFKLFQELRELGG